jgi:hypothetical protein
MFGVPYKNNMGKEEEENLLETTEMSSQSAKRDLQLLPLLLIISVSFNIFFAFLGFFTSTHKQDSIAKASYENGFPSDLGTYIQNSIKSRFFIPFD